MKNMQLFKLAILLIMIFPITQTFGRNGIKNFIPKNESLSILSLGKNMPAGEDLTVCGSTASLSEVLPSQGSGTWSTTGSAIISNPSNPGTQVSNLAEGINTFIWTPTVGTPVTRTITNKSFTVSAGANQDVKANNATLLAAVPDGVLNFYWSIVAGSGDVVNIKSLQTEILNLNAGMNIFRFTASKDGCSSSADVRVNYLSFAPDAGQNVQTCNDSYQLHGMLAYMSTGVWSVVAGSGSFDDPTDPASMVRGLSQGKNTFRLTATANGSSISSDVSIDYNGFTVSAGSDQVVSDDNTTVAGIVPSGVASIQWSVVKGGGYILNRDEISTQLLHLPLGQNIFRLSVIKGSCSISANVVINRVDSNSPITTCDDIYQFKNSANIPLTGLWTIDAGYGEFDNPTNFVTTVRNMYPGANTFVWNTKTDPQFRVTIISNNFTISAGANQTVQTANALLTGVVPVNASSVRWHLVSGGGTIINAITAQTDVLNLEPGLNTFRLTATRGNCTASSVVEVNYIGSAGNTDANENQTVCIASAVLSEVIPSQGPGIWTTLGSAMISNPTNASTQVINLAQGVNTFTWTPLNGIPVTRTITNRSFSISAGRYMQLFTDNITLKGTVPHGVSNYKWSIVSGGGRILSERDLETDIADLSPGMNIFRLSASQDGCLEISDAAINYVNFVPDAGENESTCNDTYQLKGRVVSGTTNFWTVIAGRGVFDDPSNPRSTIRGLNQGVNTFRLTSSLNGLSVSDDVSITYNGFKVDAGGIINTCADTATLKAAKGNVGDINSWSIVNNDFSSGVILNPISPQTKVTYLGHRANRFVWSVVRNGCSATDTASIVYNKPPVAFFNASPDTVLINTPVSFFNSSVGTKWLWNFGDKATASEINPVHSYQEVGSYSVKLTVWNSVGCLDSLTLLNKITVLRSKQVTGISDINEYEIGSKLYPNPSAGNVSIDLQSKTLSNFSIQISNAQAQVVLEDDVKSTMTTTRNYQLPKGIYVVKISSGNKTKIHKLLVQ